jgi:hypothetical protein
MKVRFFAAGLMLLAAAAPAAAQAGGDPAMGAEVLEEREQRPFDLLLQARYELGLTADQVTRLQAIAARLDETNRPLRAELARRWAEVREQRRAELMRMTPEQRREELRRIREFGPPPVPESLQPLAQQVRRNIGAAMHEAGTVLTPAQKARVRGMIRQQQRGRMGPGARRGPGRMGGGLPRRRP